MGNEIAGYENDRMKRMKNGNCDLEHGENEKMKMRKMKRCQEKIGK